MCMRRQVKGAKMVDNVSSSLSETLVFFSLPFLIVSTFAKLAIQLSTVSTWNVHRLKVK